jgi:hypothetical protein
MRHEDDENEESSDGTNMYKYVTAMDSEPQVQGLIVPNQQKPL